MKRAGIFLIAVLVILTPLTQSLFNPGLLLTVPFEKPLNPPTADLRLPISIDAILINQLELTHISLMKVDYDWSFTESYANVKISNAVVLFGWKYKKDYGQGSFQQSQYEIDLQYKFVQNQKNRIEITITSTKSKLGHSVVYLGGNVKQIVAVEVTNLIMNHAAISFRKTIEKSISSAIQSFSSLLQNDPKLICPLQQSHCVYMNLTLVSPPIITNKTLLIQLNGASYINGHTSGDLNPQNVLVKRNSSNIQAQIHLKVAQQLVTNIISLIPSNYDLDVSEKFDTFDLTTLVVSPLFPLMEQYDPPRPISIRISNINVVPSFNSQHQTFDAIVSGKLNVNSKNPKTQKYQQYLSNPCNFTVTTGLKIIYGWKGLSLRIAKMQFDSFQCEEEDVHQQYVYPDVLMEIVPTLSMFLKTGINGFLNPKVTFLQFNGIQALLRGEILSQEVIFDFNLKSAGVYKANNNSDFKVLLKD